MKSIACPELLEFMPTITLIEVDVAIEEIKTIIDQVSQAIELVLLIILVAGALVLIAGVSSSVDERLHESAILRALGAGRMTLLGAVAIEFAAMGALAGVLAIMGSESAGWVLQTQMLELDYQVQWMLWALRCCPRCSDHRGFGDLCLPASRVTPLRYRCCESFDWVSKTLA